MMLEKKRKYSDSNKTTTGRKMTTRKKKKKLSSIIITTSICTVLLFLLLVLAVAVVVRAAEETSPAEKVTVEAAAIANPNIDDGNDDNIIVEEKTNKEDGDGDKNSNSSAVPQQQDEKQPEKEEEEKRCSPGSTSHDDNEEEEEEEEDYDDDDEDYSARLFDYDVDGVPPVNIGKIRTSMFFSTPIVQLSIDKILVPDVQLFNQRLASHIMEDYHNYLNEYHDDDDDDDDDDKEVRNDNFFTYQTGVSGDNENLPYQRELRYMESLEFQILEKFVRKMAQQMLQTTAFGHMTWEPGRDEEFFVKGDVVPWATVHYEGSKHTMHYHRYNVVSAVYYVQVPDTAGKIVFYDPRGPRPPFDRNIEITPKAGELVLFPSWLGHEVQATGSTDEPRISIPFNLQGDWEDSAYPFQTSVEWDASTVLDNS